MDDAGGDCADAVVRARLLGSLDVRIGGQPLPALESARAESLLAFLLLHRAAPQPRSHIAFLLWPDSSEQQAHTNLRKVLHTLRGARPAGHTERQARGCGDGGLAGVSGGRRSRSV